MVEGQGMGHFSPCPSVSVWAPPELQLSSCPFLTGGGGAKGSLPPSNPLAVPHSPINSLSFQSCR